MEKLTMQEEEAMRWIWRIGPCFVKDVLAKYEDPKPPYTTLASVIKNLERKKYVKAKRYGNTYEYRPLIEETEYKRTFLGGVVTNYFANSYKEMVSFFAKDQKISTDDLKDVQAFPDANHAISPDDDFKVIYGVEAYLVDDLKDIIDLIEKGKE